MEIETVLGKIKKNRYKIIDILGKGGIGTTYAAIDLKNQDKIALKAVSLQQLKDWKQVELLEREASVLAQLNHPAIPKYLDYFQVDSEDDRFFYIVQQLAPGKSLYQLIESGWRSDETEIKKIAIQILDIFSYLHSLDPPVIHRDIKPHNLILNDDGKIFLVDFGAVQNTYYNTLMKGSTVVGTYGYMAPEQFKGKATPATDLYGLGATILYLLTHRSPNELPQDTLKINFRSSVNISEGFALWLEKILQPDLAERFSSATEALDKLNDRYLFTNALTNKWKIALNLGLVSAIAIGGIFGFINYKWAILSRLGYQPSKLCDDFEIIKNYLEQGGNPNINLSNKKNLFNCVIGHHTSSEDKKELKELVELLIAKNANINPHDYHNDMTPLSSAASIESKDLLELLIANGADINDKNKDGSTALFWAAMEQNYEIVELLIAKGADVNARDNYGKTPLLQAARTVSNYNQDSKTELQTAKLLIANGANVNAKDSDGNTTLMGAYNLEVAKFLISKGSDVNAKDNFGRTPLMGAYNSEIAKLLIANGADVNAKDNSGRTPLMEVYNSEIAKLLINKGANVNAKDNSGKTPLFHRSDPKIIKLLIVNGADINTRDNSGKTPLFETSNPEIVKLLISKGADVNTKDNDSRTPLMATNNPEIIKLLIASGVDVNARDKNGNTSLFETSDPEIAKLLITNGADVNTRDNFGNILLINAVELQKNEIVKLLITNGANVNARDARGRTPLFIIKKRKNYGRNYYKEQEIKDLLIQHGAKE
jgi:serine/threonine protein kinase